MFKFSGHTRNLPYKEISAQQAAEKLQDKSVLFVDVREAYEHAQVRIPGSKLMPLSRLGGSASELGAPDQEIIVLCRSGSRSASAAEYLSQLGYQKVYNLSGGIVSWLMLGLPSER